MVRLMARIALMGVVVVLWCGMRMRGWSAGGLR